MPTIKKSNNVSVYYETNGTGSPIIFIHPPVLTSKNFLYQVSELSNYFQTITFDIRGHGKSSYSEQPLTYSLIVKDMIDILDDLNIEKAFIVGYSTGGSIALEFLLQDPERAFGGILLGAMSEVSDRTLKNLIVTGRTLAKTKAIKTLAMSIAYSNSDTTKVFRQLFHEAKRGKAKNVEQYYHYSLIYNCTTRLREIDLPVLLLYGEKDKRFYYYASLLKQKLPTSELKYIKDVKHQLPTKAAIEVNDLIKQFVYQHKEQNGQSDHPSIPFIPSTVEGELTGQTTF